MMTVGRCWRVRLSCSTALSGRALTALCMFVSRLVRLAAVAWSPGSMRVRLVSGMASYLCSTM